MHRQDPCSSSCGENKRREKCEAELPPTYYRFTSDTHTDPVLESPHPNRETGGSSNHQCGSMTNRVFQLRIPAGRRNSLSLGWCGSLFYPEAKHHLPSAVSKENKGKQISSKRFNDFPNSHWKSLAELRNPGWTCARSVTA